MVYLDSFRVMALFYDSSAQLYPKLLSFQNFIIVIWGKKFIFI